VDFEHLFMSCRSMRLPTAGIDLALQRGAGRTRSRALKWSADPHKVWEYQAFMPITNASARTARQQVVVWASVRAPHAGDSAGAETEGRERLNGFGWASASDPVSKLSILCRPGPKFLPALDDRGKGI